MGRPHVSACNASAGRYHRSFRGDAIRRRPRSLSCGVVITMKLGLINSAWVQSGQPTSFGLRKTKELGFDSVDHLRRSIGYRRQRTASDQGRVRPAGAAHRLAVLRRCGTN